MSATPSQSLPVPSVNAMQNTNRPSSSVRGSSPGLERMTGRLALGVSRLGHRQEAAHRPGPGDRDHRRDGQQMGRDGDAERDHRRAEQRAGDGADAEAGMEARHDRAPEALLDGRALDVHRNVPGAVAMPSRNSPTTTGATPER